MTHLPRLHLSRRTTTCHPDTQGPRGPRPARWCAQRTLSQGTATPSYDPLMTRIDIHAHCFPTPYLDLLDRYGSDATAVARHVPCGSASVQDMSRRLALMDAAGVDVQVLSMVPQVPVLDDKSQAVEVARAGNEIYAELLEEHAGRFLALADLPLPHGDAAAEEAARAMDELGFVGACVPTTVGERTLADPAFTPLWEALDEREGILFVHAAGRAAHSPFLEDQLLRWMIGAPIEDGIGLVHLLRSDALVRYPRMKVVSAHMGGPVPLLLNRIEHYWLTLGPRSGFPEPPTEMLRRIWLDTVNFHGPSLHMAAQTVGDDRLLLGSDFPYSQEERYLEAVSCITGSGLEDAAVQRILGGNALDGLGLGARLR